MPVNVIDIERISTGSAGDQAGRNSFSPVFSPDGSHVLFSSYANDLITSGTSDRPYPDLYLKNLATGETTRVDTDGAGGRQRPRRVFSRFFA